MRFLACFITALIVAACGGGGGGSSSGGLVLPAPVARDGVKVTSYSGCPHCAARLINQTNVLTTFGWGVGQYWNNVAEDLAYAEVNQMEVVLGVLFMYDTPIAKSFEASTNPRYQLMRGMESSLMRPKFAEGKADELRFVFARLRGMNKLRLVKYLYPIDEPDIPEQGNRSDEEVNATNALIMKVAGEFVELEGVQLMVTYACSSGRRPGVTTYNVVGCDQYDKGTSLLNVGGYMDDFRSTLRPDQRLMLVPNFADGLPKTDPAQWIAYAFRHANVWGINSFIAYSNWNTNFQPGGNKGFLDNEMAKLVCEMGQTLIRKPLSCS